MNKHTTITTAEAAAVVPSNTHFTINGNEHWPIGSRPNVTPSLPAGFYTIEFCPQRGPFFNRIEPMTLPPKLYGDIEARAERIEHTFATRKRGTTGVMLSGEKGSGKTLLGRKLAIDCCAAGMPVIVLNKPLAGDMLGNMLQSVGSPFVLFIDEFEKVYAKEHQEAMLTVLDGVFTLHMLAILTTNDDTRLIDPLLNRPGRIFYRLHYAGLTPDFVREFASDHLKDKTQVEELVRLTTLTSLNFDQLAALIEEMNRYDEKLIEAIQFLNVEIDTGEVRYSIERAEFGGASYEMRDIGNFHFLVDLLDGDDDDWSMVTLMKQNTEGLTYKDMRSVTMIRHGVEYCRIYDYSRFSREKFSEASDEVPSHYPIGIRVIKDPKNTALTNDGLIEAVFPAAGEGDIRLWLRRPWSSTTKKLL